MVLGKLLLEEGVPISSQGVVLGDIQVFHTVQVLVLIIQPSENIVNIGAGCVVWGDDLASAWVCGEFIIIWDYILFGCGLAQLCSRSFEIFKLS